MLIKQKICMLGAVGVGKTSLVRRFIEGLFCERYLATIGVKVDQKIVRVGKCDVAMLIWDIAGGIYDSKLTSSYFRGSDGYILVNDGTHPESFRTGRDMLHFAADISGQCPTVVLLNKADLVHDWAITEEQEHELAEGALSFFKTSAKSGLAVEAAFSALAFHMYERNAS